MSFFFIKLPYKCFIYDKHFSDFISIFFFSFYFLRGNTHIFFSLFLKCKFWIFKSVTVIVPLGNIIVEKNINKDSDTALL